jgi:Zn-dependent dipeptidase, microsomal dipeptidase homolog
LEINKKFLDQAEELHKNHLVVDAHLDLAGEIFYRMEAGETAVIKNHYLNDWKIAGINLIISSVFLESNLLPDLGLRMALDQISALYEDVDSIQDEVCIVKTKSDLKRAREENKIAIILYMEGLDCIGLDIRLIRTLYEMGVRGASLTWSRRNMLGDGCCHPRQNVDIRGGLSVHGIRAVKKLEELGMFIDISHLNDDGIRELHEYTSKPYIATHSNSRSVYFNYRNLTDEQMIKMAERGGIMGLNGCECIAGCCVGKGFEKLCEHVEYVIKLLGDEHIGYGFDICAPYENTVPQTNFKLSDGDIIKSHKELPGLTALLLQRGMREDSVIKLIGKNFYDYFYNVLPG